MADLSQILQAGLMNYGQPNGLDKGLMSGDPSMQLGMQLLANSNTPGNFAGIFGRSMLGTQEAQQKNAQQQLALMQQGIGTQQAVQMFPYLQSAMQQAFGTPGQPQGQPQGQDPNGQPGAAPSSGVPTSPTGGTQSPTGSPQSMANLGAMLGLMGRPGGQQLIDAAKFQTDNDPAHATQMAAAKGDIAQDQATLEAALKSGQIPIAQAAYTKLLKDTGMLNVSAMSGDVTTFGGISPQSLGMNNLNPSRGTQTVNGVQSPLPGAPQTQQTLAGAEAQGRATGETVELTDPSTGAKYMVPRSYVTGGGRSTGSARGGSGPSAPRQTPGPIAALGPGQSEMFKGNAQQALATNKEYQAEVESGKDMLTNTAELRSAANDFTPGRLAESRANALGWLNEFGLITGDQKKSLGSAQAGQKISIQLQAAATKQLGSREAAQIFNIMGKSLPNLTLSSDGLEKVSSYMDGIARYKIARGQMAQQLAQTNDAQGVNNVRDQFVQNTNPLFFIVASAKPDQQREMLNAMGPKKQAFVKAWNEAARNNWAPRPNAYAGSNGGA